MGFILVGIIFYFLGPNQPNYPLGLLYLPASQVGLALGILLGGRWALRHAPPQTLQSQLDTQEPKE